MSRNHSLLMAAGVTFALLVTFNLPGNPSAILEAKEKNHTAGSDPVTVRLFDLLNNSYEGKLADFYVLGDIYKDPANPGQELQHVFLAQYEKNRSFGKFDLHVRSVAKMTPEQMKTYSLKQIYDFGQDDTEKFMKTDPGVLGSSGDVYLRAEGNTALATSPVTDEVRKAYDNYLTQYLIPALKSNGQLAKSLSAPSGSPPPQH